MNFKKRLNFSCRPKDNCSATERLYYSQAPRNVPRVSYQDTFLTQDPPEVYR